MAGTQGQRRTGAYSNGRHKAWQAMRIMVRFSIPELMATAGIGRDNASVYINRLIVAGYIVRHRPRVSGRAGSCDIFHLVRNSGPQAPLCWDNGQVHDPNTRKTFGKDGEELEL